MMRDSGSVKLYCILALGWAFSSGLPLLLASSFARSSRARLASGSVAVASPVAPTPRAVHLLSDPVRRAYPLLHPCSRPAPISASPLLLIASLLPSSARNSSPCLCSRCLSLCSHPTPPVPALSSPPATRSATLDQITLAGPSDAASESPRSFGNPVGSPRPTPETRYPRSVSSLSAARKTLPHSTHKSRSWSSSAAGAVVDHDLLPRIPPRLHSDPVAAPRRRRNTPSDLPAATRPGSAVTENLALADRHGRFFPYSETWHIQPVSFNRNQRFTVEYSDTLLDCFPD